LRRQTAKSLNPEHQRDADELLRLKLARQQLDELNAFTGDRHDWLAFEEEVYAAWDTGEYSDFEMTKKLRKALEGDAKNYVKLLLSTTNANPEHVLETLRRRYYHPNEDVSTALREIMEVESIRTRARKPLEALLLTIENYVHVCRRTQIEQHLQARVHGDVESKLPTDLRSDWNKLIRTSTHADGSRFSGTWIDFWNFLRENIQDLPLAPDTAKKLETKSRNCNYVAQDAESGRSKQIISECPYDNCDTGQLFRCAKFRKLPYQDRLKFINEHEICKRCVNSASHDASKCPLKNLRCHAANCSNPTTHPTLLHPSEVNDGR
jgi:hypothetical protein